MTDNELNRIWRHTSGAEQVIVDKKLLLKELGQQVKTFDQGIRNRDMREIIVAAVLMPFLALIAYTIPYTLSKIAMALLIPWCLLVIIVLLRVKKHKPNDLTLPMTDFLEKQKQYLQKEKSLLKNILYWYILPPSFLCVLFFIGLNMSLLRLVFFVMIILFTNLFLYMLNKKAVKEDFEPLLRKLQRTIDDLK